MAFTYAEYTASEYIRKMADMRRSALTYLFDDTCFRNLKRFHEVESYIEAFAINTSYYLGELKKLKPVLNQALYDRYLWLLKGFDADADVYRVKVRIQKSCLLRQAKTTSE